MFARLAIGQIKTASLDESVKRYEASVLPDMKSQKGFCGVYYLIDRKTGKIIAASLWESEADAVAIETSGFVQAQIDKFQDLLSAPMVREIYEVGTSSFSTNQ